MRFTKNMDCRQEAISKYQWDNAVLYLDGKITRKELKRRNDMVAGVCVMCNKLYVRHEGQVCDECIRNFSPKSVNTVPVGSSNEPDTFKPSYYHDQPFDSAKVQETVFLNIVGDGSKEALLCAMWTSFAVKHLLRCGRKDGVYTELKKAENYIHRARTGEWLKDE